MFLVYIFINKHFSNVLVGNIPYDAAEEQLIEIFQQVGPVVTFRLVWWNIISKLCRLVVDRDTGKPKGYGFCEYRDAETALSAMRNLNNYDFNGRALRVDFADNEKQSMQQFIAHRQHQQAQRPLVPPPQPNAPSNVQNFGTYINSAAWNYEHYVRGIKPDTTVWYCCQDEGNDSTKSWASKTSASY